MNDEVKETLIMNNNPGRPEEDRMYHLCDAKARTYGHLLVIGVKEITVENDPTVEAAEQIIKGGQ